MNVEQLIARLQAYPSDMPVKVVTTTVDDVVGVAQDGEHFVKIVVDGGSNVLVLPINEA